MNFEKFKSNLKSDLPAGLVVYLVALPLCLGVALASTQDPTKIFSGIIAGVIGGIVVGALSGSSLGVSGPAAGLIIIVLTAIESIGYEGFLLAVVIAGIIQLIAGFLKAGVIGYYFPSSVIKGMLAAIGIILILKEIPHALGNDADFMGTMSFNQADGRNTFTEILYAIDHTLIGALIITLACIAILILFDRPFMKRIGLFKFLPGALFVVVVGIVINQLFKLFAPELAMHGEHLVQLPIASTPQEFFSFFTSPDFSQLANPQVYGVAFTLAMVASLETLLSVEATDKLDPYKRNTPTNRELKAQGVGNIIAGLIGGLPITQVIVRSSANINSGGKSKLSTIIHGAILLLSVIIIPKYLNYIPLASLAAILLLIGYKLSNVSLYKSMYKLGWDQFLPFIITIVAIILTDLLKGIFIGMAVAFYFILIKNYRNSHHSKKYKDENGKDIIKLTLSEEVTFLNKGSITITLNKVPENTKVIIDASNSVHIDYDVLEAIRDFKDHTAPLKNIELVSIGVEEVKVWSKNNNKNASYNSYFANTIQKIKEQIFKIKNNEMKAHNAETQATVTPQKALQFLKDGNKRFVSNLKLNRNLLQQVNETKNGQWPFAVVLSCIDSRTSAELVFDQGLGDIFSVRVAGNVINTDILASMEYACKVAGSKLIVVLGHSKCGAVISACKEIKMGNITELLNKVRPSVDEVKLKMPNLANDDSSFVEAVSHLNILNTMEQILERSKILNELYEIGEIGLVGAYYDVETGEVEFMQEQIID